MRLLLGRLVLLAAVSLLLAAPAAAAPDDPIGVGASQVWVLRPHGPIKSVVVFGHGWGALSSPVGFPWIEHLRARGSAVVYPRYQTDITDRATSTIYRYRDGLRRAFAEPGLRGLPVVVVGHSWGATLAFRYGAHAQLWGVPVPRAIVAVSPASTSYGGPPARGLPRELRVLLMVGESEGPAAARRYWRWLDRHPRARKEYRVVPTTPTFEATHGAAMESSPAARRAYWSPLDAIVAAARGT
jgi:pimeloyl-ACP methyl ester carboxylesterase